jgi:hypothetical protein
VRGRVLFIYYFKVAMKGATSGKLENMKQTRLTNFFAIPLEKKDPKPNILSETAEKIEVTQ